MFIFIIELDKLVRRLDKRLAKVSRGGTFKPKERVISSPSVLEAPVDAPDWAVHQRQTQPLTSPAEESTDISSIHVDPETDGLHN